MRASNVLAGLLAASALIASAPAEPAASSAEPLTAADLGAWLDGYLPYALERGNVAGAVVVVVRDGEVLVQKGYGYADVAARRPVDPERTLFRLGSVGKLFTWTAVMQLVEGGRLDLDRDINEYLDFAIPARDGRPITLRNLMTHTPGFEEPVKNLVMDELELHLPLEDYLKAWVPRRIFPPGEVPAYSNYGAALAGYIVQRVSGEPFDDYVERHVFDPLGMTSTTTRQPLPAALAPRMSKGYMLGSGSPRRFELIGPSPAGAATANGADMARFMIAWLQEGRLGPERILQPETVRRVYRFRLQTVPPLDGVLLGFFQQDIDDLRIAGHDGDTRFFHGALNLFVDQGVGVYLAMNSTGNEYAAFGIRTALLHGFVDRYFGAAENGGAVDPETAREHARRLVGMYKGSRRSQSSFIGLANLFSQVEVAIDESGSLSIPAVTGLDGQPMAWREVAPFVWQQVDGKERLAARIEDGEVVMFSVDSISPLLVFQPVAWWESSSLLLPLLVAAFAAILLTVVGWPVAALIRRRYGVPSRPAGPAAWAHRLVRIGGIAVLATAAGWTGVLSLYPGELSAFSPRLDPWIVSLQLATIAAVVGSLVIAAWHARLAWVGARSRGSGWWSIVLVLSFATVLWVAIAFNLIGIGTNY